MSGETTSTSLGVLITNKRVKGTYRVPKKPNKKKK